MKLTKHILKREIRLLITLAVLELIRILMGASQASAVTPSFALILAVIVAVAAVIEFYIKRHKDKAISK